MSVKIVPSDILCEFVEVVIHNIIYARKLYPETIFSRRSKYGVCVFQCIQPDVNNYITEVLKAISFHSKKNQLKRISVCFKTENIPTEKYVIDIIELKNVVESDSFLIDLEQLMRDFILKLHNTLHYLADLNKDSTFSVDLQVTAYSNLEFNQTPSYENFPWIELNKTTEATGTTADIVPLHGIDSNILKLQVYIEKNS